MNRNSGDITVRLQVFLVSFVLANAERTADDALRRTSSGEGKFHEVQLQTNFIFGEQR